MRTQFHLAKRGTLAPADAARAGSMRRIAAARLRDCGLQTMTDDVMLIVSELVTNAVMHSGGTTIDCEMVLRDGRLRIAVSSDVPGLPRLQSPRPDAEAGRGLLLVDALADSWGVSSDGTTTWCVLTAEGPAETDPAPAPVLREVRFPLPADPSALTKARIEGRTLLTLLCWPGSQYTATDVLYVLVRNALEHGITPGETSRSIDVWLRITSDHQLLIDVTDPNPTFPDFERALAGELGRGLWGAQQLGATISYLPAGSDGKTVRATMQPGEVEL
ncbi:MAG TPA: ATP-binding protein [Streptomyces sp.]|nr:ATP-binding protein [Streptomyces sp.]